MNIKIDEIYADKLHQQEIKSQSFNELENLYLKRIYSYVEAMKLKGFHVYADSINLGGLFSKKNQILVIEFKKSKVKGLTAYYYLQDNGFSMNFRLYKCINKSYINDLNEKPQAQRLEFIKNRLKSLDERDDFTMFDSLIDQLFVKAIKNLPQ